MRACGPRGLTQYVICNGNKLKTCPACHSKLNDTDMTCLGCGISLDKELNPQTNSALLSTGVQPGSEKEAIWYFVTAVLSIGPQIGAILYRRNHGGNGDIGSTIISIGFLMAVGGPAAIAGTINPNLKMRWWAVAVSIFSAVSSCWFDIVFAPLAYLFMKAIDLYNRYR
jgi:hypothetical protein